MIKISSRICNQFIFFYNLYKANLKNLENCVNDSVNFDL